MNATIHTNAHVYYGNRRWKPTGTVFPTLPIGKPQHRSRINIMFTVLSGMKKYSNGISTEN